MFCVNCGRSSETSLCPECAAQRQPAPAPRPVPANGLAATIQAFLPFIAAGLAALLLVWGILNVFSVFHVRGTVSYSGESESEYITASEMADTLEQVDRSFIPGYLGNIIFGVACLGGAAIGILYALKIFMAMPYYDQYINQYVTKFIQQGPLFLMGALGAVGAVFQMLTYFLCRGKLSFWGSSIKITSGVNWTTWMMLALFAGMIAVDMLVLNKKSNN